MENLDLMNETSNRDVKMQDFMPSNDEIESDDLQELATKCTKLIFDSFDFLNNWAYSRENRNSTAAQSVRGFLNQFDTLMLAKANFRCGEFARSLINLEAYIKVAPEERLQEQLLFLAKIYAELDDPDSMEGLKCVKTAELTLDEQILINTKTGKLHESAACFEMMMQNGDPMEMHIKELVGCYVGLNQPETALHVSDSLLKKLYEKNMGSDLQEIMAEPLWRLGRFEELEKLVETSNVQNSSNWGVRCGLLFLKFRQNDHEGFVKVT